MIDSMKKKPEKYIDLSSDKIKEVSEIKEVSIQVVYAALNYETKSPLAMFIRAWALQNGGIEYVAQKSNKKITVLN